MSIKFIPPLGRSPLATTVDPGGKVEVEEQIPYAIWNASPNFNGSGIQVKGCGCVTMPCYFLFLVSVFASAWEWTSGAGRERETKPIKGALVDWEKGKV